MFSTVGYSAQLDEEESTDDFQPQSFDGEEIAGQHLLLVMTQERALGAFRSALGHRRNAMLLEQITDGGAVNGIVEFECSPFMRS